jgi:hypothetical protein
VIPSHLVRRAIGVSTLPLERLEKLFIADMVAYEVVLSIEEQKPNVSIQRKSELGRHTKTIPLGQVQIGVISALLEGLHIIGDMQCSPDTCIIHI